MDASGDHKVTEVDEGQYEEYEDDQQEDGEYEQEDVYDDGNPNDPSVAMRNFSLGDTIGAPKFRPANPVLPETVSVLDHTGTGGRVYLVGTAHFGQKSQEDVATTIRLLSPDFVVLELCPERKPILHMDDNAAQHEPTWDDFNQMVKQTGYSQGVLQFFLMKLSAHCTKKLGMVPGGEMRAAYRESLKIHDCIILLGDRPISITLKRAFGALSPWQKLQFLWVVLREMRTDISQEDVEKCKSSDVLEELIEKLSAEFPTLHRVLVHERDLFLAQIFKNSASKMVMSSAGPQPSVTVGVVGIGHVPGIKRAWALDPLTKERMSELLSIPEPSKVRIYASRLLFVSSVALFGYGAYRGGRFMFSRIRPLATRFFS